MAEITVVIPTYNRAVLLERAYRSVIDAAEGIDVEVIVVDDSSTLPLPDVASWPHAKLLRLPENSGPGVARNAGILAAETKWVALLDDDDVLIAGAVGKMIHAAQTIAAQHAAAAIPLAPVIQYGRTNAKLRKKGMLVALHDYLDGSISGDYIQIINREVFLAAGYAFPDNRAGAEHLLWWQIAKDTGIPSWRESLVEMGDEDGERLTSPRTQIKLAAEHLRAAEDTIALFGNDLKRMSPGTLQGRLLAATTYALLAGERGVARQYARRLSSKTGPALWLASYLPAPVIERLFLMYRSRA